MTTPRLGPHHVSHPCLKSKSGVVFCPAILLIAMAAGPAVGSVVVDGNVEGFAEGYTSGFNVTFDIENGPTGVPGGKLFLDETAGKISVGLIVPLSIDDNTYGAKKAADWGSKVHNLYLGGGGKSLEGSDKWELKSLPIDGGDDLDLKLDYIDKNGSSYATRIERFKQGGTNLDQSKLVFHTSIDYNFNQLGFSTDDATGFGVDSPGPAPSGSPIVYDFDPPNEDWVPEIMYEFGLDQSAFTGNVDVAGLLGSLGTFHMSPNKKSDKHKVFPQIGPEIPEPASPVIPEPSSLVVWCLLAAIGITVGWRRQRCKAGQARAVSSVGR